MKREIQVSLPYKLEFDLFDYHTNLKKKKFRSDLIVSFLKFNLKNFDSSYSPKTYKAKEKKLIVYSIDIELDKQINNFCQKNDIKKRDFIIMSIERGIKNEMV